DGEHHRFFFGVPGVIDAGPPYDVVALSGQQHAAPRQLHPETATDQHEQRRAFLPGDPLRTLVAPRVHTPLDLDVLAVSDVINRLEMPEQPTSVTGRVDGRVAYVDVLRHKP